MHLVGFEPTPPKRTELESVALDHSATDAQCIYGGLAQSEERNVSNVEAPGSKPGISTQCTYYNFLVEPRMGSKAKKM